MTDVAKPKAKKKQRRLSEAEKLEAFEYWESGQWTVPQLVEHFGISKTGFHQLFKRHGIVRNAKAEEYKARQLEELRKQHEERLTKRTTKAEDLTDLSIGFLDGISRSQMLLFKRAQEAGQSLALYEKDIKTYGMLGRNIKDNVETARDLAGLNIESAEEFEELPEITVTEMTQDDIDGLRRQQEESELELMGQSIADAELVEDEER